jgi:hypothetical protein
MVKVKLFASSMAPSQVVDILSIKRLLATAARSWSGGTMVDRGGCQIPPHLLVVGAENSLDHGPARLRQEAKRGARRRRRRDRWRDRAAAAVTSVF